MLIYFDECSMENMRDREREWKKEKHLCWSWKIIFTWIQMRFFKCVCQRHFQRCCYSSNLNFYLLQYFQGFTTIESRGKVSLDFLASFDANWEVKMIKKLFVFWFSRRQDVSNILYSWNLIVSNRSFNTVWKETRSIVRVLFYSQMQ